MPPSPRKMKLLGYRKVFSRTQPAPASVLSMVFCITWTGEPLSMAEGHAAQPDEHREGDHAA